MDSNRSRFPVELWDGWTMNPERTFRGEKNFNVQSDPDFHDWNRIRDEVLAMQRFIKPEVGSLVKPVSGDTAIPSDGSRGIYLVDASTGAVDITLPDPAINVNVVLHVKKIDSSGNTVTLIPYSTETIDGASSLIISTQWAAAMLVSDGSNWYIL